MDIMSSTNQTNKIININEVIFIQSASYWISIQGSEPVTFFSIYMSRCENDNQHLKKRDNEYNVLPCFTSCWWLLDNLQNKSNITIYFSK